MSADVFLSCLHDPRTEAQRRKKQAIRKMAKGPPRQIMLTITGIAFAHVSTTNVNAQMITIDALLITSL